MMELIWPWHVDFADHQPSCAGKSVMCQVHSWELGLEMHEGGCLSFLVLIAQPQNHLPDTPSVDPSSPYLDTFITY